LSGAKPNIYRQCCWASLRSAPTYEVSPTYVVRTDAKKREMKIDMKKRRKFIFILTAIMITAAGLTGCSTFGGNRSEPSFGPRIESASGAFEDRIPESSSFKPLPEMTSAEFEQLGDVSFSRGDLSKAFVRYEKCLGAEPENKRVTYKKGLVLLAGNLNEEAAEVFKALIAEAPDHALAWEGLGRAFFQRKDMENAETAFKKAVSLDVRLWKAHNCLGMIYDARKQHDLAIDAYISAIAENPREATVYNNLGFSFYMTGNYGEAIEAFGKAIEHGMEESRVYNNMGMAMARAGEHDKALTAFSRAGGKSRAYNNLGCIYLSEARYDNAVACFEKALNTSPGFYVEASRNLKQARAGLHNANSPNAISQ